MKNYCLLFMTCLLGCASSEKTLPTSCLVPKIEYVGNLCVPPTGDERSFIFRETPVREAVIKILSSAEVSFAIDKNLVDCSVSGNFINIPWEEALSLVLKSCKLARTDGDNGVVRILTAEQLKSEYEPMVNLGFEISNKGSEQKSEK